MIRFSIFLLSIPFLMATLPLHADELSRQQRALHILNRLAYGARPGDVEHVMQIGVEQYINEQLNPEYLPLPQSLTQQLAKLTISQLPPAVLIAQYRDLQNIVKQDVEQGKQKQHQFIQQLTEQTASARLARAINSPRQLNEVMVDFWLNHFNVFEGKGLDRVLIANYEREAIRPYTLGRFRDLLGATAKNPAMLFYLDNWLSAAHDSQPSRRAVEKQKANGLNENYARELMELHTLGADGGYTQKDVTELARIFTGWTFDPRSGAFTYVDLRHDQGSKEWLNHHINPRGQAEGEFALDILASSPSTAHHISYQLAQYFVADQPPPTLVEKLAQKFLQTDGDIRSVLDTLFHSPEFWEPTNYANKFKTPYQYVTSTMRVTDISVTNYRPLLGILHQLGMPLYGCQTPDGYKNTEEAWLNPDTLSRRINFATAFAAGRLPFVTPVESNGMESHVDLSVGQAVNNEEQPRTSVDAQKLMLTLNGQLSDKTHETVSKADPRLQAALMLGSPDFMRH